MTNLTQSLSQNVRAERARANLTQVELAEKSGISVMTLIKLESGKASPNLRTVERIASSLGLQTCQLFAA